MIKYHVIYMKNNTNFIFNLNKNNNEKILDKIYYSHMIALIQFN